MSDPSKYAKLLEPGQIGKVPTRNRIYKSAAGMHTFSDTELEMNENSLGFYDALARGGVGIISVEAPTVDYPWGCRWSYRYRMDDDKYIPGMKQLVDLIHGHGCPTFMQMEHDGPWQNPLFPNHPATFDGPPVGASAVNIPRPSDFHRDMIRPLTIPEIEDIVRKYIDAAERAQKAGFDGVDLNMGSTHIGMNFLSPFWNRRDDEYGGDSKKRAKLVLDVIGGIKKRCGDDFPIVVCLNGFESGYLLGEPDDKVFNHELALESMAMASRRRRRRAHDPQQLAGSARSRFPARLPVLPRGAGPLGQDASPVLPQGAGQGRHEAHDRRGQEAVLTCPSSSSAT